MKTATFWVGVIITLPFIALEAIIKMILFILYSPFIIGVAIIYPLIKKKNLNWIDKWWKYATTWKKGFLSGYIYKMWEMEN